MIESDQNIPKEFSPPNDEIDLKKILSTIWNEKIIVLSISASFAVFAIAFSLMLPNYYTSESILISRDSKDTGMLGQYAGLAAMAGVALPTSGGNAVYEIMEIIQSREFVKHLITFENVLPSIMAAKSFDTYSKELSFDPEIYNINTKEWISNDTRTEDGKPSYIEAHKEYLEMLSISQNKLTGLVTISIEHKSPIFAKDFLTLIIKESNNLKREIDIDNSTKALSYLEIELSKTSLVEIKKSINQLIEAQLETQMIASIHEEYSLISLEPPFIPEDKSKPSRSLIVILGTLLGGILSVTIVLARGYMTGTTDQDKKIGI